MPFQFQDKILVLRYSRLGRLPPALYETEILKESGFPILVFEFAVGDDVTRNISGNLPKLRYSVPRTCQRFGRLSPLLTLLWMGWQLYKLIRKSGKPKVVVSHGLQESCLALFLQRVFSIKFVIHAHEVFEKHELSPLNRLFLQIEKLAFQKASFVIFPEKRRAVLYRRWYRFNCPIFLVANAPRRNLPKKVASLRSQLHLTDDDKLLYYVGGIGPTNVLEEAIVALKEVPHLHFILWGWGETVYLNQLKEIAKESGVSERVHFLGLLDEQKWENLNACDLAYCVYRPTSLRLKYPVTASNKFLEAMALGKPVITSNEKPFRDFLKLYPVGKNTKDFSSQAITEALQSLMSDKTLYRNCSETGKEAYSKLYHFEVQFQDALRAFQMLYGKMSYAELPSQIKRFAKR